MISQEESAQEMAVVCAELGARVEAGRGCNYNLAQLAETVFGDNLYGRFKALVLSVCGTVVLRGFLFDEDLFLYGLFESNKPFEEWPRDHGIDLEQESWGVFYREGAQIYEERQLLLLEPGRITAALQGLKSSGSSTVLQWLASELNWRIERYLRWKQEFERYYGIPALQNNVRTLADIGISQGS